MEQAIVQPLQLQCRAVIVRNLKSFDQGRDTRGIHMGDFRYVNDDGPGGRASQYGQKLIAKGRRGIDAEAAMQAHQGAFFAVIHGDFETVSRTNYAAFQHNSPRWLRACTLPNDTPEYLRPSLSMTVV
jgi:hypothetical protein